MTSPSGLVIPGVVEPTAEERIEELEKRMAAAGQVLTQIIQVLGNHRDVAAETSKVVNAHGDALVELHQTVRQIRRRQKRGVWKVEEEGDEEGRSNRLDASSEDADGGRTTSSGDGVPPDAAGDSPAAAGTTAEGGDAVAPEASDAGDDPQVQPEAGQEAGQEEGTSRQRSGTSQGRKARRR